MFYRDHKNRVLLVYPNLPLSYLIPTNIGILTACLRQAGFEVKVFDTTFYRTQESEMEKRIKYGHYKPSKHIPYKQSNVYKDLQTLIDIFKPNVIGVSTIDATFNLGLKLIQNVNHNAHIIFGGIYPTFNPERTLAYKEIDSICVGEGEEALVELCRAIQYDKDITSIENIWTRNSKTELRPPIDINNLPYEDFTKFPEESFYRPMQGELKKMLPITIDRGCPYSCTFCAGPVLRDFYNVKGIRYKKINDVKIYLRHMFNKYRPNYLYFNSETFFSGPINRIKELADFYKQEINLPFCCMTRFDTVNTENIKLLKDMGCDRISFGLECGNEQFRTNILNKKFSNNDVIEAINLTNYFNIGVSMLCIVGFPDETEKLIWETINLCKTIKSLHKDITFSAAIFQPYSKTKLRDYCIKKKYIKPETFVHGGLISESVLDMPQLSKERISWFMKHFNELV